MKMRRGNVGRFQVMALLQAARYYLLKGDLDKAKSFGLNRAIFYAWAKKRTQTTKRTTSSVGKYQHTRRTTLEQQTVKTESIGDEQALVSDKGWFTIGEDEQTPEDYDREVIQKINTIIPYDEAWRKALEYLRKFDRTTLENQREFFEKIYKPVRDSFFEKIRQG